MKSKFVKGLLALSMIFTLVLGSDPALADTHYDTSIHNAHGAASFTTQICKHPRWSEYVPNEDGTCTTMGTQIKTCLVCGQTKTVKNLTDYGHILVENEDGSLWNLSDMQSCTTSRFYYKICSDCGIAIVANDPVAYHIVPYGTTDYATTRATTPVYFGDAPAAPENDAPGHLPGLAQIENYVAATCDTAGSYDSVIYCTRDDHGCGFSELSRTHVIIDPTLHTPGTPVIENRVKATCTEDGHFDTVIYCLDCNVQLSRVTQTVDSLGHEWVENAFVPATCTEDGKITYSCAHDAGHTKQVSILATGHLYSEPKEEILVEATCNKEGKRNIYRECEICGNKQIISSDEAIPKFGHIAGNPVIENRVNPTDTKSGGYDMVTYCVRGENGCNGMELSREHVTIAANGHDVDTAVFEIENEVAATCTEPGSYDIVHYCQSCNEEVSRSSHVIEALGHDYENGTVEVISHETCTEDGTYVIHCARDYSHVSDPALIPAHGHNLSSSTYVESVEKKPTCEDFGIKRIDHICDICNTVIGTTYQHIDAIGHELVTKIINKVDPTTDTDGGYDEITYCQRDLDGCGNVILSKTHYVIEKLPIAHVHEYSNVEIVNATCLYDGSVKKTCSCGDFTLEVIPALGHIEGDIVIENNLVATEATEGGYDEVVYCTRDTHGCDHMELSRNHVVIDKLPPIIVEEPESEEPEPENPDTEEPETEVEEDEQEDKLPVGKIVAVTIGGAGIATVATSAIIFPDKVAFLFLFWWRRRKIKGTVHGTDGRGYRVTLSGKDKLEIVTNEYGEFIFKNLKKDTYLLNVYDVSEELIFSCDIFTEAKTDGEIFTVITSKHNNVKLRRKGRTYFVDIED